MEDTYESHRHRNAILNYVSGYNNLSREYGQKKMGQDKVMRKYNMKTNSHWERKKTGDTFREKPVGSSGPLYKFKASVLLLISADDPLGSDWPCVDYEYSALLCLLFCLMFNYNHVHSYNIRELELYT